MKAIQLVLDAQAPLASCSSSFLTSPSNFDFTDLVLRVKLLLLLLLPLAVELSGLVESAPFGLVSLEEIDAAVANSFFRRATFASRAGPGGSFFAFCNIPPQIALVAS